MNTNNRSVSLVENLQLEISDSLFNESLLLADVDNDDDCELVVGQINGDLLIFKGSHHKPWRICHHLGMITCVGVGDLWNQGENLLFCITAEGWCHIFHITVDSEDKLEPVSSQLLPSNCKVLLLADVDGDGLLKLVTGHADRVVHVHKLEMNKNQDIETKPSQTINAESTDKSKNTLESSTSSQARSKQGISKDITTEHKTETPQKREGKSSKQKLSDTSVDNEHKNELERSKDVTETLKFDWRFVSVNSWTVSYQINSLVVFDVMTTRYLLASQPGGTYAILMSSDLNQQEKSDEQITSSPTSFMFNQLPVFRGRNKGIPTNLITVKHSNRTGAAVSSTRFAEQGDRCLVLCTQEGNLIFINRNKQHWLVRVDQGNYNLFAVSKLDIAQDGNEEVVVCSWDGNTYIVDNRRNVVQFKFEENVMAFCAGCYAYTPRKNLPALVYVTSSNRVVIYYNVRLSSMTPTNLDIQMKRKTSQDEKARAALSTITGGSANNSEATRFYEQCVYGKSG